MTEIYSEEQTLTLVARLTRTRLTALVEAEAVVPTRSATGPVFRKSDLARLDLLCEFADVYDMEPEALAVVISLIDQLHAARNDLAVLRDAIGEQPPEVRARIAAAIAARTRD
ncbi:hypothetical protein [Frigidibacter sp. ROC022]|uniref:hypothetical protein n=1 Tax=Frigidibacter sp. ROC022 TaxID=2971796 RepID=UPI00215A4F4D|nr:hypothetical protein [Frigidibacter sp. ROC022]MCR8725370.1 hypothetical protein [Frigidibacter sp. ROC022]